MLLDFLTGIHEARSIVNADRVKIDILAARRMRLIVEGGETDTHVLFVELKQPRPQ